MQLQTIQLENFRNYEKATVDFNTEKNVNLFIGDNAQGKTNFLEAIMLLSLAKSFRAPKHVALIKWDKDFTRIKGSVKQNSHTLELEYFVSKAPIEKKNLRKNGTDVSIKEFIGQLNIVLFHPEDLNMLYLSPSLRRKYINTILSQTDPLYFDALVNYNRIVKQRNKALMLEASDEEIDVWDEKLSEYGSYIFSKRNELIGFFNGILDENYHKIAKSEDKIKMKYKNSFNSDCSDEKKYKKLLEESRRNDRRYQQTQKGIHRDDIEFHFNDKKIEDFASRGEMRTLVIALKLTEIEFIKDQTGRRPILLLDDVFSELDKKRQQFLVETISQFQSFVTTTHHNFSVEDSSVFEIDNGILN